MREYRYFQRTDGLFSITVAQGSWSQTLDLEIPTEELARKICDELSKANLQGFNQNIIDYRS